MHVRDNEELIVAPHLGLLGRRCGNCGVNPETLDGPEGMSDFILQNQYVKPHRPPQDAVIWRIAPYVLGLDSRGASARAREGFGIVVFSIQAVVV
jgi:hypothetical protein